MTLTTRVFWMLNSIRRGLGLSYYIPPNANDPPEAGMDLVLLHLGLWCFWNDTKRVFGSRHRISREEIESAVSEMTAEEQEKLVSYVIGMCEDLLNRIPDGSEYDHPRRNLNRLIGQLAAFPGPRILAEARDELSDIRASIRSE